MQLRPQGRERMNDAEAVKFAERVLASAWAALPVAHRDLLEAIGADRSAVTTRSLGGYADDLLRSSGEGALSAADRRSCDAALGLWIRELKLLLVNAVHPHYTGLDKPSREAFLAQVSWHEWGHALGIVRSTPEDVAAGRRLLGLVPDPIAKGIRSAGYGQREYTHEIVAGIYALLMLRRQKGEIGRPIWLHPEIYELVRRVVGWTE
jgi:hypothetical protein